MTGLREPPKGDKPSRVAGRVLVLIVLAGIAGVVIYSAVINQRVGVTETTRMAQVERDVETVGGLSVALFEDSVGREPVVFLHDDEVSGSLTLAPLSSRVGETYRTARIDLPGFGLSDRIPESGQRHTVSGLAESVAAVVEQRFLSPVVLVGVGFGGEVAAEIAHEYPQLVSGLVLVDTDFDRPPSFEQGFAWIPWIGPAMTYTFETGGRLADTSFDPYCEEGGWCPTAAEAETRAAIVRIAQTTASLNAFRNTEPAAIAPSNLEEISVPMAYVWSLSGPVTRDSVDSIESTVDGLVVVESSTFQAHLEDYGAIVEAIDSVNG